MSNDIFGPSLLAGGTITRPGETRAIQAGDTFFKDCSDPNADDGTQFQAAWFNQVLAVARALSRGNGAKITSDPIVPDDNTNDNVLLQSVQYLIQRGLMKYAVDTGSADAIVISLTPAMPEYKAGSSVIWIKKGAAANATTTPSVNINGLGPVTVVQLDGTAIEIGQLPANSIFGVQPDGTNLRLVTPPTSATTSEAEQGVLFRKYISPATLLQRRTPYFVLSDAGGTTVIPNAANTNLTHLTADGGHFLNDGSSSIASSRFTCGTKDAGLWLCGAYYGVNGAGVGQYNIAVAINGVGSPIQTGYVASIATSGFTLTRAVRLAAGDVVQVQAFQNSGGSQSAAAAQLFGVRAGG